MIVSNAGASCLYTGATVDFGVRVLVGVGCWSYGEVFVAAWFSVCLVIATMMAAPLGFAVRGRKRFFEFRT